MSFGGKLGSGETGANDYYASGVLVINCGAMQGLTGIVFDDKLIWPETKAWSGGVDSVESITVKRTSNIARVRWAKPHGAVNGTLVTITGFSDASLNVSGVAVSAVKDAYILSYPSVGANFAETTNYSGKLTKVAPYVPGDIVRYGGNAWVSTTTHASSPSSRPGESADWERFKFLASSGPNPVAVTVAGYGTAIWYHGTHNQVLDPATESITTQYGHPPSRNQSKIVLKDFLQGRERESAGNFKIRGFAKPNQTLITGVAAELDDQFQANPVACLAEILTHKIWGLGMEISDFETGSWQNCAEQIPADCWISPLIVEATNARELMARFAEYFDGWFRFNENGKLEIGWWPRQVAPPTFPPETILDIHDLEEPPEWKASDWNETVNRVLVKFTDGQRGFKDDSVTHGSLCNVTATNDEVREMVVDLPWLTIRSRATAHAAEKARVASELSVKGTATARPGKAYGLDPVLITSAPVRVGQWFTLRHTSRGVDIVCRIKSVTVPAPPSERVEFEFESEHGFAPRPFSITTAKVPVSSSPPEQIRLYEFIQPTSKLSGNDFALLALCARTNVETASVAVWIRKEDATGFYRLQSQSSWAVSALLTQSYAATASLDDNSDTLRVQFDEATVDADRAAIGTTQTADAIADDNLLIFLVDQTNPRRYEICTVKSITIVSGVYRCRVKRARFGTKRLAFVAGDHAWIAFRDGLVFNRSEAFQNYVTSGETAVFRLQSRSAHSEADLADPDECPDLSVVFGDPFAPAITFPVIEYRPPAGAFAAVTDFTIAYDPAGDWKITYSATDANGDLVSSGLRGNRGKTVNTLSTSSIPILGLFSSEVIFSLPHGEYVVSADATDSGGRSVNAAIPGIIHSRTGASTLCAEPVALPLGTTSNLTSRIVTMTCHTPSATIFWEVVDLFSAPSGTWPNSGGTGSTVTVPSDKTLHCYAVCGGFTDSGVITNDYQYSA